MPDSNTPDAESIVRTCREIASQQFAESTFEGRLACARCEIELLRTKVRELCTAMRRNREAL